MKIRYTDIYEHVRAEIEIEGEFEEVMSSLDALGYIPPEIEQVDETAPEMQSSTVH